MTPNCFQFTLKYISNNHYNKPISPCPTRQIRQTPIWDVCLPPRGRIQKRKYVRWYNQSQHIFQLPCVLCCTSQKLQRKAVLGERTGSEVTFRWWSHMSASLPSLSLSSCDDSFADGERIREISNSLPSWTIQRRIHLQFKRQSPMYIHQSIARFEQDITCADKSYFHIPSFCCTSSSFDLHSKRCGCGFEMVLKRCPDEPGLWLSGKHAESRSEPLRT